MRAAGLPMPATGPTDARRDRLPMSSGAFSQGSWGIRLRDIRDCVANVGYRLCVLRHTGVPTRSGVPGRNGAEHEDVVVGLRHEGVVYILGPDGVRSGRQGSLLGRAIGSLNR